MIAQQPSASGLPEWMVWFAFVASAILTLLKILELILRAVARPQLDFRLTRELFIRMMPESGDSFFVHAVVLARHGPVLVESIESKLEKIDGAQKVFEMDLLRVGEKVRGVGALAENFFVATTPLAFIPVGIPQRTIYLCALRDYTHRSRLVWTQFQNWVWQERPPLSSGPAPTLSESQANATANNVRERVARDVAEMMETLQLEPGRYRLSMKITYRRAFGFMPASGAAMDTIKFTIPEGTRERVRAQLTDFFLGSAANVLTGANNTFAVPQVDPEDVTELRK